MCCDSPPFCEKDIHMLSFLFCRGEGGGVEDGLDVMLKCFGSLESKIH